MAEWQNGTGWKEWFEITGADGVDFHPIGQDPVIVLQSNTKEDILEKKSSIQGVVIHSGRKLMAKNIISRLKVRLREPTNLM